MKNSITNQLQELGLSNRQIKRFNNICNYRGMSFSRATKVRYCYLNGVAYLRIEDNNLGDLLEIETHHVFAR